MSLLSAGAAAASTAGLGRSAISAPLIWLLYTAILASTALAGGLGTELNVAGGRITLAGTNGDIAKVFGQADAATYARGGNEIFENGVINDPSYIVLWPPGFFVFHALILLAVGPDGPAVGAILVATLMVWGGVLTLLYFLCRLAFRPWVSFAIPLCFLLFPFFREYLLRDGVVFTESLSTALWMAGMLVLLLTVAWSRTPCSIAAGLLFGIAAYVRASVDLVLLFASALVAVDVTFMAFYGARIRGSGLVSELKLLLGNRQLQAVILALLAFHITTGPYRIYKAVKYGSLMFSTADYYYTYLWLPPEDYTPVQGFVLEGGGPVACVTSPEICKELKLDRTTRGESAHSYDFYRKMAVATLLARPVQWVAHRARHLPQYWFSKPSAANPVPGSKVPGTALLLALVSSLVLLPFVLRQKLGQIIFLGMAMLYGGHFLIFLFIHYEVRYLYWPQAAALLFAIAAVVAWRMNNGMATITCRLALS